MFQLPRAFPFAGHFFSQVFENNFRLTIIEKLWGKQGSKRAFGRNPDENPIHLEVWLNHGKKPSGNTV
jgi:hypothetical protein